MPGCGIGCKYRQEPEVWKTVPHHDHYVVSNHGRVKNTETGKFLRLKPKPYVIIKLYPKPRQYLVHKLVAEVFLDQSKRRPDQIIVNHLNGKMADNHLWNLEYCTPSGNSKHASDTGLLKRKLKRVLQIDMNNQKVVKEYESCKAAAASHPSYITHTIQAACTAGICVYGYLWTYKEKQNDDKERKEEYESTASSGEIWKPLPSHKHVEISDQGRARNNVKKRLYKLYETRHGYIRLPHFGKMHVLVANLFVKNNDPVKNDVVDHIDSKPNNNRATNLRWCTNQLNTFYACGKPIIQLDPKSGKVIKEFDSIKSASEAVKICGSAISRCLSQKSKSAGGFKWTFAPKQIPLPRVPATTTKKQ